MSLLPSAIDSRSRRLISRVVLSRQLISTESSILRGNLYGNGPYPRGSRRRFQCHKFSPQCRSQGNFLGGDAYEIFRLRHHERLETETILDKGQTVPAGSEVAE